jgi:hypothetical protein
MSNYPLLNVFWTMLEFFLWILWFFLLFKIITDLFRSHDLSGWAKAGWILLVIVLPFLGVLLYVIIRGRSMAERDRDQARQADAAFKQYVRQAASPPGAEAGASRVDELTRLADLKASGALTEDEFRKAKDKLLA